jgi:hypothetical protein
MSAYVRKTAEFGELVAAVFDVAAQYSSDQREVSSLATRTVMYMLLRMCKASLLLTPATHAGPIAVS